MTPLPSLNNKRVTFSVLTYNLEFNRALKFIPDIIDKYQPDIMCLQEVAISKKGLGQFIFPGYRLAAASGSFFHMGKTYGQANFYREDKFIPLESRSILLPKTYYEVIVTLLTHKGPRTALCSDFVLKQSLQDQICVCNLHLTALQANNKARNKQLYEALDNIDITADQHAIILGDFNYPFRKRSLQKLMSQYNLSEATSNIIQTHWHQPLMWRAFERIINRFAPISLKFDYILHAQSLQCLKTEVLEEFRGSDHYPVLSRLSCI